MKFYRCSLIVPIALGMLALVAMFPIASAAATAPQVVTLTATNVTGITATLKGTVNPGSATTTAWLEWGPGNAFKFSTATTNVGSGASPLPFSASISGLTSGVIYRCRAVASNSLGVVRGLAVPFGTPTVTPNGVPLMTVALNAPFIDPGATATGSPASIAVGDSFTLALKADGRVVGWGINTAGQIAIPNAATNIVAIAAGYTHSLALRADGTVLGWGTNDFDQLTIPPEATNVAALAAGSFHSLALRKDGTVVAWGSDDDGQISVPPEATNVVAIAAGYSHSLALRSDGSVVEWGVFPDGVASPSAAATNVIAIAVGVSHSLALRANGTVVTWGSGVPEVGAVPASATNIVAIAGGYAHSVALRADGSVIVWGLNNYGETNVPPNATNVIAIGSGFGYNQALLANGSVIGWGNFDSGRTITPTNLTANFHVTITGTVNTSVVGTNTLTYRATNNLGFAGTASRAVEVVALVIASQNRLGNGAFQFAADFTPGSTLTVLTSTNVTLPPTNWTVLGTATENPAGHFEFTDTNAPSLPMRFYRLRLN